MDNKNILTQDNFDALLTWLDPDRENAGKMYEKIRKGLINFFYFRGCSDGEYLADETINRVIHKITSLDLSKDIKAISIFYGFASNVLLEELKKRHRETELDENFYSKDEVYNQTKFDCLDVCLQKLSKDDRDLAIKYYLKSKSDKFEHRRNLAESLDLNLTSLHVKLFRLRKNLRKCIEDCCAKKSL
jgi:DNA-directed RNA polymerase specialized sigma24 family protein